MSNTFDWQVTSTHIDEYSSDGLLVGPDDDLRDGVWPRSVAVWMAAFYVALFVIRPWEELLPWLQAVRFERFYAIAMIVALMATRGFRIRLDLQSVTVLGFAFTLGLSYCFARNPSLAWDPFYVYITLVIFYFELYSVIRTMYELVFMVNSYVVTMGVYLSKSLWEFFVHGHHRYDQGVVRLIGIESTFGGPNNLAMSIDISLPMALFLYQIRHDLTRTWPEKLRRWYIYGLWGYAILAVTALALTNSRSGMVGFVAFVVLTCFRGRGLLRKLTYAAVGVVLLLVLWTVLPEDIKGRYRSIWDPEAGPKNAQASAEGRSEGFAAGLAMFKRFPVLGVGIGNFIEYRVAYLDGVPLQAHNLPGQLLGETGVVGSAAFLCLIGATWVNCRQIKRRLGTPDLPITRIMVTLAECTQVSLILLLVTGLFGHNVYRFNWLWLGAFSALVNEFVTTTVENRRLR